MSYSDNVVSEPVVSKIEDIAGKDCSHGVSVNPDHVSRNTPNFLNMIMFMLFGHIELGIIFFQTVSHADNVLSDSVVSKTDDIAGKSSSQGVGQNQDHVSRITRDLRI